MPDVYDSEWRVGRKLGRTVYARQDPDADPTCDILLGMFDSPDVAAHVVALHNQERTQRYGVEWSQEKAPAVPKHSGAWSEPIKEVGRG